MSESIEVQTARLAEQLNALPAKIAKNALARAVAAGARVVRAEVKARAPVAQESHYRGKGRKAQPGTLKRAIVSRWNKQQSNQQFQQAYTVTVRRGKKEQGKSRDAFYASWVEFGHRIVPRSRKVGTKGGKNRYAQTITNRRRSAQGQVAPRPYLRPGFEASYQRALNAITDKLREDLSKPL